MGCIFRLGCLVVLAIAALIAWSTRDRWWPREPGERVSQVPTWQRVSPEGAERTRTGLQRLQQPTGPVFVSLHGADVASHVLYSTNRVLPSFTDSAEAAVIDDRLVIRGMVPLRELGGTAALGPFAAMLGDREPVEISGRIRIIAPGQAELTVAEMKVRDFRLPPGLIPRLLRQGGAAPPGTVSENGIPVTLPSHVGDVRLADGRVTLYKNIP